jgi:alpha-D-ribose 1-methylphosphonate 5-triphosphate synthase subunit PhnG
MSSPDPETITRQTNMAILARSAGPDLAQCWSAWPTPPSFKRLRGPETGLVMVRGRAGGGGAPFNLGEATVTRASVQLDTGEVGHAYALGRDGDKVTTSALIDALWQRVEHRDALSRLVFMPLGEKLDNADHRQREEAAATKVNFFTLVRGED